MSAAPSQAPVADTAPQLEIAGRIATIRLNNPSRSNRLSPADLDALREHVARVNQQPDVLVLRFIATGKYFCSGYDISSLSSETAPSSLYFGETIDLIESARPVTIAAVQGGAYGGGTDLCLACDFRLGTPQANMFMPAVRLGLHFYPGGMRRYLSRLGVNAARRLFLTGEQIQADEMLKIGFLTELVDADALPARTEALSAQLAGMAPLALLGIKHDLNGLINGSFDVQANAQAVRRSEASADMKEGALAWKEKRAARFQGR
ncbi:enoyl-CoA hydratase/isomerase family protein [Castellaniella caeni]|uniref:enoyl-CoA hydratase/isomerase family protein n=1 Tax=Castellaniella caeni TaxID=266123 RepID=UPI000834AEFD|nr:enoyl-CoA hydratase/isomerase family protein [Castellaniella caeni]